MNRRRVLRWTGIGFVVAGLAVLGYVGWQLFGTNIVSERQQQQLVNDWRDGATQASVTGKAGNRDAVALVRIPRFGDDYVMPVLEGVGDANLAKGLAHFRGTAGPGQPGNYAIAGHRVTHGEPLRDMPKLEPGDDVVVETRKTTYTYKLDTDPEDLIVGSHDVWVVSARPVNPDSNGVTAPRGSRLLTLTTCAELFHTDERMVVFGHLVGSRPT